MTVRWKPLLILSGVFFVVAVVGVIAMAWTLVPRSSESTLKLARSARTAGRFPDAEIHYKQALQFDPKSAAIHEEFAGLYREWSNTAPAERQVGLRAERMDHLVKAVKFDKATKTPRRELLEIAMSQDSPGEAVYWAREVLKVEPENTDATYVLASEALEFPNVTVPELKRQLKALDDQKAPAIRRAWVRARLAQTTSDDRVRDEALAEAARITLAEGADAVDRMARLRLEALAIQTRKDKSGLEDRVKAMLGHAKDLVSNGDVPPTRFTRVSTLLEQTQRSLAMRAISGMAGPAGTSDPLVEAIEVDLEQIFQKVLAASQKADLKIYQTYAEHLRFRQQRDKCLQVIDEALRLPVAARPASLIPVQGMHTIAVEMALSKAEDADRFKKAAPHVQALLTSTEKNYQGLGHLFQGAIDLEQSGLVKTLARSGDQSEPATPAEPKLRASALNHLKQAAALLPDVAEAHARYGVALVLNQEQNLGRQYLQSALRMGNLDPQYQFWAAWTVLQAGYPEEAEPILDSLFRQVAQGTVPADMKGTLHQLSGELYQARRGPGDLERAAQEFEKANALAKGTTVASNALRMAQIDVQLGRSEDALARIDQLRSKGQGGPSAEHLAVLILEDQGKGDAARKLLGEARSRYPRSAELAGLEAAIRSKDGKPEEADKILSEHLAQEPDNVTLTVMRAQLLSDSLKRPQDARKILIEVSDRSENSSPLVQLAHIDMEQNDLEAAATTISKIRSRWKDAATGDILEGQLALKRGNLAAAVEHFNEALKKDPENKVIQFWKAQIDGRTGQFGEAAKALEAIVKNRPTKEVDPGVTLMSAAQSALANLSLQSGNLDEAIRRFEELKRNSETGTMSRADRWQLITAYAAKRQWPVARRELAAMLNDLKNPPTDEERVQGANLYRLNKEDAPALAQLDYVLKVNPSNPAAVVTRAYFHLRDKQQDAAAVLLRRAIDLSARKTEKPPAILYLMLAAVENEVPPQTTASKRCLAALDQGLAAQPDATELVRAKYLVLASSDDPKSAVTFVESQARAKPKGPYRRMLADVLREQKNYAEAEKVLRELTTESPQDVALAAAFVQAVLLGAADAASASDGERERTQAEKAAMLVRDYRTRFPGELAFFQAECDMLARNGDLNGAIALTKEIDKTFKSSTEGPMLRARLFTLQGRPRDVAQAYSEALERNPRLTDVRVLLGQTQLRLGNPDEALKQARMVLDVEKERLDAALLEARAMATAGGSDRQAASRQEAISKLEAIITAEPRFEDAYHTLAELLLQLGRRADAIAVLQRAAKANPDDGISLAQLVQLLAQRGPDGSSEAAGLAEARRLVDEVSARDEKGSRVLAAAVGLHKAGQLELAMPVSQKAASLLDSPVAHLNLGDLLLSRAESQPEPAESRAAFQKAIEEYDRVLKSQPNSVEAVNNKAWVMHTYLGQSQEALDLAQALVKRANPAMLPAEFYDTLGAIQEGLGRTDDAERSYQEGLRKSPELPALNYHFGKLIAGDKNRTARAKEHLGRALAARNQLSPAMVKDAERLVQQISRAAAAN